MNAKKHFALLVMALMTLTINAQKIKCDEVFKAFETKVNAGNNNEALADLSILRNNCRGYNEQMYTLGSGMLDVEYQMARNEKQKKEIAGKLIDLYTEYDKFYPQSDAAVRKAMLQHKLELASNDEVFAILDEAYTSKKGGFNDHNAVETYFLLYLKKFQESNGEITPEKFVEKYGDLSSHLRNLSADIEARRDEIVKKQELQSLTADETKFLTSAEASMETLQAVGENLDILASKHIGCSLLTDYYTGKYEIYKGDAVWVDGMVNTLLNSKCFKADVLQKGAKEMHALEPTSQTAFNLATIELRKNNIRGATAYFEESAQLEQDLKKKAGIYYRIASVLRNSDRGAAKTFAMKAAQHNPSTGKPYIFLAELYSSAARDCSLNEFEQKALLWLSIETVKKAGVAEPKYQPTVASMVEDYTKRLPSKKDLQAAGKRKGDKITYGCWINETVTIPNIK